jgi:hypothetical protein
MAATFSAAPASKIHDITASQATGAVSTGIGYPSPTAVTGDVIADSRIGGTAFNLTVRAAAPATT